MAAFCACCGAEITLKAETCPVCGTPRHGMSRVDPPRDVSGDSLPENAGNGKRADKRQSCGWTACHPTLRSQGMGHPRLPV
jgi:hypothetical protein